MPLFQPEHGFCQNNGSERGQTQDWYFNEKNGGDTSGWYMLLNILWHC